MVCRGSRILDRFKQVKYEVLFNSSLIVMSQLMPCLIKLGSPLYIFELDVKRNHTDSRQYSSTWCATIHSPDHQLDISPPKWSEVERIGQELSPPLGPMESHTACIITRQRFSMEADEGGVAETNNSNCVAEGRRHPNPQGKVLWGHQPVSPNQPPEHWR